MTAVTETKTRQTAIDPDRPLIVVSADGHLGPRLVEDLRPYCPKAHIDTFDEFAKEFFSVPRGFKAHLNRPNLPPQAQKMKQLFEFNEGAGHYDVDARVRDMDRDGVAIEVVFESSQNMEPVPFLKAGVALHIAPEEETDLGLAALGFEIYNRWLADAIRRAPDRVYGAALVPAWDVEASIKELKRANDDGIQGVTLLTMRDGILPYEDEAWEPFWAACNERKITLCGHSGQAVSKRGGATSSMIAMIEGGGHLARRYVPRMIFAGIFERYPNLNLVITEQNSDWWVKSLKEWDSVYYNVKWQLGDKMPVPPSEYARRNLFAGASFLAPFEAKEAVEYGFTDNVIWGRDYPHIEGTSVRYNMDDKAKNPSRLSMRYALAGLPDEDIVKMVETSGLRAYHLDGKKLQSIASRIDAPSVRELSQPIERVPDIGGALAFRKVGGWS